MSEKTNVFTDEGRLLQTEYAIKNVSQAGTIMGMVCTDGIVLFGLNLTKTLQKEKIYKITNDTYCVVSGLFGDANMLIKSARVEGVRLKQYLREEVSTRKMAKSVARLQNTNTLIGNARPYAVSFLFAGYDNGKYVLYSTDPSGTINNWKTWAIGADETTINQSLRNDYKEGMDIESGLTFLLESFKKAKEVNLETSEKMEIFLYTKDEKKFLETAEIRKRLENLGVKI